MAAMRVLAVSALLALAPACVEGGGVGETGGSGGSAGSAPSGGDAAGGATTDGSGGHGCFATEATCDGACVDVKTNPLHCGRCDNPCNGGANQSGQCVDGECVGQCADGFLEDDGVCKNYFGAHESYPAECSGCSQANAVSGDCSCPASTTDLVLAVQSDCPGMALRASTELRLCTTGATSPEADFGGAYQVDDFDGLCGAMPGSCRRGNPLAGGACACPEGFQAIGMRSIIRLPCDQTEVGSVVFVCGNPAATIASFGGAYQFDDFDPQCRVTNPWTGACSCPAGTTDRAYRVMVDGAQGLYGSTMHLCGP